MLVQARHILASRSRARRPCIRRTTRSAITDAGISGNSASSAATRGSNGPNDGSAGLRSYFGGESDATAFTTVPASSASTTEITGIYVLVQVTLVVLGVGRGHAITRIGRGEDLLPGAR
jgi:hypothetical protein